MDIKQLEYFIAIAEEGQITAAAKRLNMAQPPLSQQLKHLEEELGVVLFERTSRRLQLSEAGQLLLMRARQITDLSNCARQELIDFGGDYQGTVLVGITPTAIPMVLSTAIAQFHRNYPKVKLEFYEGNTSYILDIMRKGIVDLGIVRTPFDTENYGFIKKKAEPMSAVMLPDLNWSEHSECHLVELEQKELIFYRRYETLLEEAFSVYGIRPQVVCKTDRSYTALNAAESGLGIALLPESAVSMAKKELVCKTILESQLHTSAVAIWQTRSHLPKAVHAFLEYFEAL